MRALLGRAAVGALIATMAIWGVTGVGHAQGVPEQPRFTKQAVDANGLPLTGPLQASDTVNFVLSYWYGNAPPGSVKIDDKLSTGLTYVNPSTSAVGWSYPLVPYNVGNQEAYTNAGPGPATSFIVNVPVGFIGQKALTGGDGTFPVSVASRLYEFFHHEPYGQAQVNCLDLLTLATCAATPGSGAWPRSLGAARTTPMVVRTAVAGGRIYYPSARYDSVPMRTYFGIGCWDTATEAPCSFIDLPTTPSLPGQLEASSGATSLDPHIAGVVADPANPNRLFMFAIDQVYCVDVSTGLACNPWTPAMVVSTTQGQVFDMIAGEAPFANRLYVQYGGPSANILCIDIALNGARCSPWGSGSTDPAATPNGNYGLLSLVPNGSGAMQAICVHPFYWAATGRLSCFDASSGTSYAMPSAFPTTMNARPIFAAFHLPGIPSMPGSAGRVLYPQGVDASAPYCFDFATAAACTPFTAGWPWATYQDYGYAVDPAAPDRCLLGLGNGGTLWRFARDGSYDKNGCTQKVQQTFDLDGMFCAFKPKEVRWTSIIIIKRPPELDPKSPITLSQGGQPFWNGTIGQAVNDVIAINKATVFSQGPVTLDFQPTYSGQPKDGYQLEVTFASDVDPQICYQATVNCGQVSNKATLTFRDRIFEAGVNLGDATGRICQPGLLKVCKVAGTGITMGAPFNFTISTSTSHGVLSVPAGPAPGGTCKVGPSYSVGTQVGVTEAIPPGDTVSSIIVAPQGQLVSTNLASGAATVTIGAGVTEVTFTDKRTGYLEICKSGEVLGNFTFLVNPGGLGPFVVPAGACSPAIEVAAGPVVISETTPGAVMVGCTTFPPGICTLGAQTATVTVVPGDVSTMTIAFITNRRARDTGVPGTPSAIPPAR